MAGGSLKAGGALVEMTIDMDISKFPVLEAGFMILGMVTGKEGVIVAASSSDFSVSDSNFFFFCQRR